MGLNFLHIALGFEFPFAQSFELRVTLRGIDRLSRHIPSQAPPVSPSILHSIVNGYDADPNAIAFSCAFLFAFFLFARISNIVPPSVRSFCADKHLCRGDIRFTSFGLLVTFQWSKTRQFGDRLFSLPLVSMPHSLLCPVRMFKRMVSALPAAPDSPAFVFRSADQSLLPITKSLFVQVFRQRLQAGGIPNAQLFRGHSFRHGGTNYAFRLGLPGEVIQVFGDWKSEAYKVYLEIGMSAKLQVASAMASHCT